MSANNILPQFQTVLSLFVRSFTCPIKTRLPKTRKLGLAASLGNRHAERFFPGWEWRAYWLQPRGLHLHSPKDKNRGPADVVNFDLTNESTAADR
jgi:hypothetical protein